MVTSHRYFLCARCRRSVRICSCCDRGQRYCSDRCSAEARRIQIIEAGARYQRTERGRRNHAARQQVYLERRAQKVTHQGSLNSPSDLQPRSSVAAMVLLYVIWQQEVRDEPPTEEPSKDHQDPEEAGNARGTEPRCHFCGLPCGRFARRGPIRRRLSRRRRQARVPRYRGRGP